MMMKFLTIFVLLIVSIVAVEKPPEKKVEKDSDKAHPPHDDPDLLEYAHDDPHGTEHGNLHTQLFLSNAKPKEAFEHLSEEQRRELMNKVFREIDENHDGFVDFSEMKNRIIKSTEAIDQQVSSVTLANDDLDGDGKVSWHDILQGRHKFSPKQLKELHVQKVNDSDILGLVEHIEDDRRHFQRADINKDGFLDKVEYAAFSAPWKYKHMLAFEADDTMDKVDLNKDKFIDLQEYEKMWKVKGKDKDYVEKVRTKFRLMDINNDDKLSHDELLHSLEAPMEKRARKEAKHIIEEIDANHDGLISRQEAFKRINYMLSGEHEVEGHGHQKDEL